VNRTRSWGLQILSTLVLLLVVLSVGVAAKPVTVELMINNNWTPSIAESIRKAVIRFEETNPDIKVEVTQDTNFLVRVMSGISPDVVTTGQGVGNQAMEGLVIPLNDLISDELYDEIFEPMWMNVTWDGNIYGVPALEQGPRIGMVWNQDILDNCGLTIDPYAPLTWDEFYDYADKLTLIDADGQIVRMGYDPKNGQNSRLMTIAPLWDATGYLPPKGEPSLDMPGLVEMVESTVNRIFSKYPNWKYTNSWYSVFIQEGVAVTNLGGYAPGEVKTRDASKRITSGWAPSLSGQKVQQVGGWALSIASGAKNPKAAMRLIEFLATDLELQLEIFYNTGFYGGGKQLYQELLAQLDDPAQLWYLNSLFEADSVDAIPPDPLLGKAGWFFEQACKKAFNMEESATSALAEANRLFAVRLEEAGRL
jgi:ABC-type glycerol-3-phosphate transport system substrate-binding protein